MTGNCGSTCPVQTGFYRYTPSIGGNAVLLAAHCLLIPAFLYLGFRSATPVFSITSVAGLALGVVGFLGRLLLHHSPERQVFFAITLIGTVLGPTFITGAVILTLRHTLSLCGDILTPLQRLFVVLLLFFLAAGAAILEAVGIVFVSYNMGDVGVSLSLHLITVFPYL